MPRTPQEFAPRDAAVLHHTALYRVIISAIAAKLFFTDSANASCVFNRLSESAPHAADAKPLLQYHKKALPHGYSYAQLTAAGCRSLGVSAALAKPLTKPSLDSAIAISYACAFGTVEYHRVKRNELLPLLGDATPAENVPHIVTPQSPDGMPAIFRVYHAFAAAQTCITHLRGLAAKLQQSRELLPWLRARTYGIAVLAPTREAKAPLSTLIARSGILKSVLVVVEHGPTTDTLHEAMKGKHE
jgi:hypothetical protein